MAQPANEVERVTVAEAGLSDALPDVDRLGFGPYLEALEAFLMAPETKGPLTISIEGPWGVGKSSFMKLLRERIASRNDAPPIVTFNAWRHEKSESLWAAFALAVISQLTPKGDVIRLARINFALLKSRIDWSRGRWPIARAVGLLAAFVVLALYAALEFARGQASVATAPTAGALHVALSFGVVTLAVAAAAHGVKRAREVLGNPLAVDLTKYVEAPRYRDKLEFLDSFDADLAKIVAAYVGPERAGKILVFIDDLDRTEASKAAGVMQAINLLMSSEGLRFIFILGIDRRAVAASLAANADKLIAYLAATPSNNVDKSNARHGLQYGYTYLEKFIQIPFAVPRPSAETLPAFIASLDERARPQPSGQPQRPESDTRSPEVEVTFDTDSPRFRKIIAGCAAALEYNPRRLKQFVNVFRLRAYIASKTGLFVPDEDSRCLTLEQLGKFTAATLRWPQLAFDLAQDPTLLQRMLAEPKSSDDWIQDYWRENGSLQKLLSYGVEDGAIRFGPYDMRPVDVSRLLEVSPAYVPPLREQTEAGAAPPEAPNDAPSPQGKHARSSAPPRENSPLSSEYVSPGSTYSAQPVSQNPPPPPIDSSLAGSPEYRRYVDRNADPDANSEVPAS